MTAALMLAVYAIVNGNQAGWTSAQTLGLLAGAAALLATFLTISPLQVGLAFLPANLIMGAFSLGISAKLVMRFGIKPPLATGLLHGT